MEQTVSTRELCKALAISKSRLDQWVARDLIEPEQKASAGPSGRQWKMSEAIRIVAFDRLLEVGVNAAHAKVALQYINGFVDDEAFLVMSTGMVGRIIPPSQRGTPPPTLAECKKVHMQGDFDYDVVRGSDLGKFLANPDFYGSVVVNLNTIEAQVYPLFQG